MNTPESPVMNNTTPEAVLSRFAAAYAERGAEEMYRLDIVFEDESAFSGMYVCVNENNGLFIATSGLYLWDFPAALDITRIDYSNARYRGDQPLYEREG